MRSKGMKRQLNEFSYAHILATVIIKSHDMPHCYIVNVTLALLYWHCYIGIAILVLLYWHCYIGNVILAILYWQCYIGIVILVNVMLALLYLHVLALLYLH